MTCGVFWMVGCNFSSDSDGVRFSLSFSVFFFSSSAILCQFNSIPSGSRIFFSVLSSSFVWYTLYRIALKSFHIYAVFINASCTCPPPGFYSPFLFLILVPTSYFVPPSWHVVLQGQFDAGFVPFADSPTHLISFHSNPDTFT